MPREDPLVQGYAQALFAVAEAEGALGDVEDELFRFGKILEQERGLRDALADPELPADRKKALLGELLGDRATRHTVNLVGFIVDQGRATDLPRIVEGLVGVAAERRRSAVAEVRAAAPLTDEQRARLAEALSRATGRRVDLKVLVDPSVIGGAVARVGDQVFDGTVRSRLQEARERMGSV